MAPFKVPKWQEVSVQDTLVDLTEKAYMLSFCRYGLAVDWFVFSLPPQNEKISYHFRKAETQTFNGTHIDDYGVDGARISLTGTTWGRLPKKICTMDKPFGTAVNGEEEIFILRDLLLEYKQYQNGNLDCVLKLDDLSKPLSNAVTYTVAINDFEIHRDKSQPFVYNYTLDFKVLDFDVIKRFPRDPSVLSVLQQIAQTIAKLKQGFEDTLLKLMALQKMVAGFIDSVTDLVDEALEALEWGMQILHSCADLITGTIEKVSDAVTHIADGVLAIPAMISTLALTIADDFINAINALLSVFLHLEEAFLLTPPFGFPSPC